MQKIRQAERKGNTVYKEAGSGSPMETKTENQNKMETSKIIWMDTIKHN